MTTYGMALAEARAALGRAGIASAALDARLLLAAAAGLDMAALIARERDALPPLVLERFSTHLQRRIVGEPVARILGEKEFWGLPFKVDAATLVPRPETETIVAAVLAEAGRLPKNPVICDLGAGCGAILIALLTELPDATGTAVDISGEALGVARENAARLGVGGRISFRKADFASPPTEAFDIVVSNPPYIETAAIAELPREVGDYDPHAALDGGADGLDAYRMILAQAHALLKPGGLVALEVGRGQAESVATLCREAGLAAMRFSADLAGILRVVVAEMPGRPLAPSRMRHETRRKAAQSRYL